MNHRTMQHSIECQIQLLAPCYRSTWCSSTWNWRFDSFYFAQSCTVRNQIADTTMSLTALIRWFPWRLKLYNWIENGWSVSHRTNHWNVCPLFEFNYPFNIHVSASKLHRLKSYQKLKRQSIIGMLLGLIIIEIVEREILFIISSFWNAIISFNLHENKNRNGIIRLIIIPNKTVLPDSGFYGRYSTYLSQFVQ